MLVKPFQDVRVGVAGAVEVGDLVALSEGCLHLLAEVLLGNEGLTDGGGREGDAEGVRAGRRASAGEALSDVVGGEVPLDEEAVRGQAAVKRAAGDAVKVGEVNADDAAKFAEVEVGVGCLEGVEGPMDGAKAALEGVLALGELEGATDAGALELR